MLKKRSELNKIYILSELEKHIENENSFSGIYKDINKLIISRKNSYTKLSEGCPPKFIQNQSLHTFSNFKVINSFKVKE